MNGNTVPVPEVVSMRRHFQACQDYGRARARAVPGVRAASDEGPRTAEWLHGYWNGIAAMAENAAAAAWSVINPPEPEKRTV